MKNLLLPLMLLFIAVNSMAQVKGNNTIILPAISLSTIKNILFQNGYTITSNDTAYISTSSKELSNVSMAVKLMIQKRDSLTLVKGLTKATLSLQIFGVETNEDFSQLDFGGQKNSPYRKAWLEMDRIAKLLSPNITYATQ